MTKPDWMSSRFRAVAVVIGLFLSSGLCDASTRVPLHLANLESVRFGVSFYQHGADGLDQQRLESVLRDRGARILESAGLRTSSPDEVFLTFSVRVYGAGGSDGTCYAAQLGLHLTEPVVLQREGASVVPGGAQTYVDDQVILSSNLEDLEEEISAYLDILVKEFVNKREVARDYLDKEKKPRQ